MRDGVKARTGCIETESGQIIMGRDLYNRLGVVAGHMENPGRAAGVDYHNKAVSPAENRLLRARSVAGARAASKTADSP